MAVNRREFLAAVASSAALPKARRVAGRTNRTQEEGERTVFGTALPLNLISALRKIFRRWLGKLAALSGIYVM
jgi:hypothetical protein